MSGPPSCEHDVAVVGVRPDDDSLDGTVPTRDREVGVVLPAMISFGRPFERGCHGVSVRREDLSGSFLDGIASPLVLVRTAVSGERGTDAPRVRSPMLRST